MGHHKLRKMKVTDGFLGGLEVKFSDGLICIIGGRGSGKTTILELLRFALNCLRRNDSGSSATSRFKSLVESNLGRGTVEVEFETREGLIYIVERRVGEDPIVRNQDGDVVDPTILSSGNLIDAAIFSQNEVEEIALRPGYLRDVLDRFCSPDLTSINRQLEQLKSSLQRNASELVQIYTKTEESKETLKDLPDLEIQLNALNVDLKKAKLAPDVQAASKRKSLRTQESSLISRIRPPLRDAHTPLQQAAIGDFEVFFTEEVLKGPNGEIFQTLQKALLDGRGKFSAALQKALEILETMTMATEEAEGRMKSAHLPQEAAYQDILKKMKENQDKLKERDRLSKKAAELLALKEETQRVAKRVEELRKERRRLLSEFSAQMEARFRVREDVTRRLTAQLSDTIRIRVDQGADREIFRQFLVDRRDKQVLPHYTKPINKVINNFSPIGLAVLVESKDIEELATEADIEERYATGLLTSLGDDLKTRYELESIELDDVPSIELFVGNEWRVSSRLSTGQMCSVVLPLLLLESVVPLVVDQPEDNLDNRFVTENVVDMIVQNRERRQMLFITHNPNIPVLGLAEQVIVMDSSDGRGMVLDQGGVDKMKDQIIDLLEGGEKAFQARKEQYGW